MSVRYKKLKKLSRSMSSNDAKSSNIDAGQTYIGQMISHDIVPHVNSNSTRISPTLNLDSIYGEFEDEHYANSPSQIPLLNSDGSFRLAKIEGHSADFFRMYGRPLIVEPRNDGNVIISQLHVFWMRFHNLLLNKGYVASALEAKHKVIKLFQAVVVEEFARQIMTTAVHSAYFEDDNTFLDPAVLNWQPDTIPDFFRFASFRFGHSIVRNDYIFSDKTSSSLSRFMNVEKNLTSELVIDWKYFFGSYAQKTEQLDSHIAEQMARINLGVGSQTVDVPFLNLLAAKISGLESGVGLLKKILSQSNAEELKLRFDIGFLESFDTASFAKLIRKNKLKVKRIPLWPYLLHEAKIKSFGMKLGPLGSMLNAEVLSTAIRTSSTSIYTRYNGFDSVEGYKGMGELSDKLLLMKENNEAGEHLPIMSILTQFLSENE